MNRYFTKLGIGAGAVMALLSVGRSALAGSMTTLVPLQVSTSVAPSNELNPYGLLFVPSDFPTGGKVQPGQILVSNFNDNNNVQGKGSSIITIDPKTGETGLFFEGTPPIGFTNALRLVKKGFIFAGSVFTTDANGSVAAGGPLLVLDAKANVVAKLTDSINGPWGLAINDNGDTAQLFVSNVLDGTITRVNVSFAHDSFAVVGKPLTIASGYAFGTDSAAVVVGPAGLAYDRRKDILYVAAEKDNEIFALAGASSTSKDLGMGNLVYKDPTHLHGPLGLLIAPDGNLLTANDDPAILLDPTQPSEIVEFTKTGQFVRQLSVDPNSGGAFAIAVAGKGDELKFAYVDDFTSTCTILNLDEK